MYYTIGAIVFLFFARFIKDLNEVLERGDRLHLRYL